MSAPEILIVHVDDDTETNLTTRLAARDRYQAPGTAGQGKSVIAGHSGNAIASDLYDCTIAGGGNAGRENVIGGDTSNVGTDTANEATTGTGANYSTISGGYDNVASGLASTISGGAHHKIESAVTHGTIGGGSLHAITDGDYHTIGGGTENSIDTDGGSRCTIGGGSDNSISGAISRATIGGGSSHSATATGATIGGGETNAASGQDATIAGGGNNTASGVGAAVPGGQQNTASANYSHASGVWAVADKYGQHAQSAGRFAAAGDAQSSVLVLRRSFTGATPVELRLDGGTTRLTIADDTTWAFSALVVARRTDADNESAAYELKGCIDRNAGTVALVGTVTKTVIAEDTAGWDVSATADDTNKALSITVTGEANKTIRWVARVTLVEVTG